MHCERGEQSAHSRLGGLKSFPHLTKALRKSQINLNQTTEPKIHEIVGGKMSQGEYKD